MVQNVDLGFHMVEADNGTTFAITGAGIGGGAWFGFFFAGAIVGLPITLMVNMDAKTGGPVFVTWLLVVFSALGIALWMNSARSKFYRFIVTRDTLEVDGKSYAKRDISELLVRDSAGHMAGSVPVQGGTVIVGTGVVGAAVVGAAALGNAASKMGEAAGMAITQSLAKRGNSVCIRHGRHVIPLARYLKEGDAVALFNTLREVL
ncbi:hypothetical protein [Paenirhodobacter sp. CAU 1674]|uniref:hypothetical protein n=1 Tax=Paenirhodobacter sp. CAU 1674 TaxID=3032596 RepID=UPI0023DC08E7|nr:hypothetical protein [Paenirhodobacter sp. CAU 1674]MDF2142928.1 hypothetical protein [Paenirhodobacter sp. CAU 1674]